MLIFRKLITRKKTNIKKQLWRREYDVKICLHQIAFGLLSLARADTHTLRPVWVGAGNRRGCIRRGKKYLTIVVSTLLQFYFYFFFSLQTHKTGDTGHYYIFYCARVIGDPAHSGNVHRLQRRNRRRRGRGHRRTTAPRRQSIPTRPMRQGNIVSWSDNKNTRQQTTYLYIYIYVRQIKVKTIRDRRLFLADRTARAHCVAPLPWNKKQKNK